MDLKKERESNIELMRIISILIIIFYHLFIYSIIPNYPELRYISNSVVIIAHIGVIIFIIISGYFGMKFSLKKFLKLFLYGSFYSIIIYIAGVLLNPELFNIKTFIMSFIPPQWLCIYLCLYLLSPIINIPLKTNSNRKKIFYIVILIVISYPLRYFLPALNNVENPISFLLIYYYIGNYLRTGIIFPSILNLRNTVLLFLLSNAALFIIMLLSSLNFPIIMKIIFRLFIHYNGIGLIINSVLFFLIFSQIKIDSKLINWVSRSTLAVFFIHENIYLSPYLYNYLNRFQNIIENPIFLILWLIPIAIILFILSVIIDKFVSPVFYFSLRNFQKNK